MPATINIWETSEMSSCAQTGGTWTYTGSLAPAPIAPLTYNGVADFTGITLFGDYEFTYTVGTHTSVHTVTFSIPSARVNNVCATARFISDASIGTSLVTDYNNAKCPGYDFPTASGESEPGSWQYGTYNGDLWYYFDIPAKTCSYNLIVSLDGSPYSDSGIAAPALAIYSSSTPSCTTKSFVTAAAESSNQTLNVATTFPAYTNQRIWIRVSSIEDGDFDLRTQLFTPSGCTDVSSPAAETWGYETGNVFGDETGEVWGY